MTDSKKKSVRKKTIPKREEPLKELPEEFSRENLMASLGGDNEWEDGKPVQERSEIRDVMRDFNDTERVHAQSDYTEAISLFITACLIYEKQYTGIGWGELAKWLSVTRLSIKRQSRSETVNILRGAIDLRQSRDEQINKTRLL